MAIDKSDFKILEHFIIPSTNIECGLYKVLRDGKIEFIVQTGNDYQEIVHYMSETKLERIRPEEKYTIQTLVKENNNENN